VYDSRAEHERTTEKGNVMTRILRALSVLVVATIVVAAVPAAAWAESNIPPGEALPFEFLINPQAKGKKLTGFLTIAYEFGEVPEDQLDNCPSIFVNNMFVVTTLERGNTVKPFNTDFSKTGTQPFCFDNTTSQINVVLPLLRQAVDFFFSPAATYEIKSVKEFLGTGTGAASMEIKLAVKPSPNVSAASVNEFTD
jgi:hypothetical protein